MQWWVACYKHIYVCKHLGNSSIRDFCYYYLVCVGMCVHECLCAVSCTQRSEDSFGRPFSSFALSRLSSGVAATLCTVSWHSLPSLPFIWSQPCPAFYAGSRIKLQLSGSSVKHFYLLSHPPILPP